ncbi:MAG: TolC family protein [Prevotella sp.]|jgi:outer membrane protein TolC
MKKILILFLTAFAIPCEAQRVLSLDSCRAMALRNNKTLSAARLNKDVAFNVKKVARTQYLPKVNAAAAYDWNSRHISLINKSTKASLYSLGTNSISGVSDLITSMVQNGVLTTDQAQAIGQALQQYSTPLASIGNQLGKELADALTPDTKNVWAGSVTVRQPIFMGGAIKAANKIADINEDMANNTTDYLAQQVIYSIDEAYWTTVSLRQKKALAYSYKDLVSQLNSDVHKMIKEGVATRSDGLKVDVRANEADMQILQVEDGLVLSKMLLCQLCGLPLNEEITLEDEKKEDLGTTPTAEIKGSGDSTFTDRPEVRLLQNAINISEQNVRLARSNYYPHVALVGGYTISNPNTYDGFQRKFGGAFNIGVGVTIPVWNWFETRYKIRAAKTSTAIAQLNLRDTQEKIQLQVTQGQFKLNEAHKRLAMANSNLASANENLRCANVGFKEGVMDVTDVMEAQTAWQKAQSDKIDAQVQVKLSEVNLKKAYGTLNR